MPSDAKKPMVVWRAPRLGTMDSVDHRRSPGDRPFLLLPIEDRALRVGDHLFRRDASGHVIVWQQPSVDEEGEWWCDGDDLLADLLMDAVEGVEP